MIKVPTNKKVTGRTIGEVPHWGNRIIVLILNWKKIKGGFLGNEETRLDSLTVEIDEEAFIELVQREDSDNLEKLNSLTKSIHLSKPWRNIIHRNLYHHFMFKRNLYKWILLNKENFKKTETRISLGPFHINNRPSIKDLCNLNHEIITPNPKKIKPLPELFRLIPELIIDLFKITCHTNLEENPWLIAVKDDFNCFPLEIIPLAIPYEDGFVTRLLDTLFIIVRNPDLKSLLKKDNEATPDHMYISFGSGISDARNERLKSRLMNFYKLDIHSPFVRKPSDLKVDSNDQDKIIQATSPQLFDLREHNCSTRTILTLISRTKKPFAHGPDWPRVFVNDINLFAGHNLISKEIKGKVLFLISCGAAFPFNPNLNGKLSITIVNEFLNYFPTIIAPIGCGPTNDRWLDRKDNIDLWRQMVTIFLAKYEKVPSSTGKEHHVPYTIGQALLLAKRYWNHAGSEISEFNEHYIDNSGILCLFGDPSIRISF